MQNLALHWIYFLWWKYERQSISKSYILHFKGNWFSKDLQQNPDGLNWVRFYFSMFWKIMICQAGLQVLWTLDQTRHFLLLWKLRSSFWNCYIEQIYPNRMLFYSKRKEEKYVVSFIHFCVPAMNHIHGEIRWLVNSEREGR